MALPPLREELALLPGPHLADGQPSWTLHDPVRNQFFQIDWPSFEILSRWFMGDAESIAAAVCMETTLQVETADVERLALFNQEHQLLQPEPGSAARLAEALQRRRGGLARWLLHNYLFFRIPLVRPDRWLARWAGRLDFLYSRGFLHLTLAAGVFGLLGIYREWARFSATLVDLLSTEGLFAYGATIAAVKMLHELGHGLTARRYGCRVPTMGVAFLVLWPVAYTDTNEVWKLTRRDQRLKVAAAGIAVELMIAAWATLAWVWLPEGWPKSAAFLLSTTTWIATLAINASPFLRFDGYFMLSDYLQVPNLHARAFALARWDLRERLFALGEPVPEHFPQHRHTALLLFAWATWVYRLVLFLGIAVLVYHFFIKALGIFLFLVEIGWFVLLPLWHESQAWRVRWPALRQSRRARRSALMAGTLTVLFVLPWPTRIGTSGLLQPQEQFAIYAPAHARIAALPVATDARVDAGTLLVRMDSPELQLRAEQSDARQKRLSWQSAAAGFDSDQRSQWQVLNEQLATAEAEAGTVSADAAAYAPVAPYAGTLRDVDSDLRVGDWVGQHEAIGWHVREDKLQVVAYIDDRDIYRIAPGDRALFVADGMGGPDLRLEVASIDRDATRTLTVPELASLFGGQVPVREKNGVLYPEQAVYRVVLKVVSTGVTMQHAWRGRVTIAGTWEAPGLRFLRQIFTVFWREGGF
jgi:putative peptide zinc metalloprotease protein